MNKTSYLTIGVVSMLSALPSRAVAGTCQTSLRNVPFSGSDVVVMICKHNAVGQSQATVTASNQPAPVGKTLTVTLDQGIGGEQATIQGLDVNGNLIPGCSASDGSIGGSAGSVSCGAATRWRGFLAFRE